MGCFAHLEFQVDKSVLILISEELEALLREKDRALQTLQVQQSVPGPHPAGVSSKQQSPVEQDFANPDLLQQPIVAANAHVYGQYTGPPGSSDSSTQFTAFSGSTLEAVAPVADLLNDPKEGLPLTSSPLSAPIDLTPSSMDHYMELRSWPPNLPTPDVTRHL